MNYLLLLGSTLEIVLISLIIETHYVMLFDLRAYATENSFPNSPKNDRFLTIFSSFPYISNIIVSNMFS
jgi:hypothetical protein